MIAPRAQIATALLLAVAAGTVDSVSFLVLHKTFTANMTGNTTELGIAAGRADPHDLVPLAAAVATFILSIAAATAGIELATRRGLRSTAAPALLGEAALLAVFMLAGRHVLRGNSAPDHTIAGFYLLLTVAIVAMGTQTAALTKALGKTIRTTYVSGLITTFTQELVNLFVPPKGDTASYLRDELGLGTRRESLARVALHVAVWGGFIGGAVWGGYGEARWSTWVLALPLALLSIAAAIDLRQPVHSVDDQAETKVCVE